MTVTIGGFSCSALTAQPIGYEETDTSKGLTARHWRLSGLLTRSQWSSLLSVYNTWRDARINDPDTLLSQAVGTTVSLSSSSNGLNQSASCWFVDAPTADQAGQYVQATAVVVDADEALEVILAEIRKRNEATQGEVALVDCPTIVSNLNKQKAETDCELNALEGGLADDFAEQDVRREKIDKQAALTARAPEAANIAVLDLQQERQAAEGRESAYTTNAADLLNLRDAEANSELRDKQAVLGGRAAYATGIAAVDLDQQVQDTQAQETAYTAGTADLEDIKSAESHIELLEKEANLAGRSAYATGIASVDLDQQLQDVQAQDTAYTAGTADLEDIKYAESHIELLDKQANLAGRSTHAVPIAAVDLDQQVQDIQAQDTAYSAGTADLEDIKYAESHIELLEKQANLAGRDPHAVPIATVDLDQQVQDIEAQEAAYVAGTSDLVDIADAESHIELMQKQAQLTGRSPYSNGIALADLALERQAIQSTAYAYNTASTQVTDIKAAEIDIELVENASQVTAYAAELETLKASRSLLDVYEKYINENLPNLGTVSYGATIYLTKPAETRVDGPTVGFTAAGKSLISGPLTSHVAYEIEGYLAPGDTPSAVLTWYDSRLSAISGAFPTTPPTFTAEPFLVSGVKGTRYSVSMTVVTLI